ncbi:MAG: hypothetical protein PHD76_11700 [Methylacidiphilales bacterium]|nr:hypothetical protein [Candidatus Methylacidiphilales bacterium]
MKPKTHPHLAGGFIHGWGWIIAGFLLVLYYLQAVTACRHQSVTFDETTHLTGGYLLWTHPECKHTPSNGVLAQQLAALPLLFNNLSFPELNHEPWSRMDEWGVGYSFLYTMGNSTESMLWQGRAMIALLGLAAGALVFVWSRELFGMAGGLISLFVFAFCPTMLAQGTLVSSDMAAAFGFLIATHAFWKATHRISAWTLLYSTLGLGLLIISKMSSILIALIFALILVVRIFSSLPVQVDFGFASRRCEGWRRGIAWAGLLLTQAIGVIGILWLVYDFNYLSMKAVEIRQQLLISGPVLEGWVLDAIARSGLIPPAFVEGLTSAIRSAELRMAFLNGRYSVQGWWWFFPYAFLVKTPLASLALILMAGPTWILAKRTAAAQRAGNDDSIRLPSLYELSPLLILVCVYAVVCLTSKLNIGYRHMLPMIPPLYILAGMNAWLLFQWKPWGRLAVGTLLAGVLGASLSLRPHYLAFFNSLAGGPKNGYRHLVDSSLDWGQDLPSLKDWLDKNESGKKTPVYFSYFGTGSPEYYGIKSRRLPGFFDWRQREAYPMEGGVYCISATTLQSVYNPYYGPWCVPYENLYRQLTGELSTLDQTAGNPSARLKLFQEKGQAYWEQRIAAYEQLRFARLCAWLRQREPDDEVGYSILIYRLSDADVQQALSGQPAELLPAQVDLMRR